MTIAVKTHNNYDDARMKCAPDRIVKIQINDPTLTAADFQNCRLTNDMCGLDLTGAPNPWSSEYRFTNRRWDIVSVE